MAPDSDQVAAPARLDPIERAHLEDPRDASHVMHRYAPPAESTGLLQRFWIPVWSVPPGEEAVQRVLQHPVSLLVVTAEYARFYGVVPGLSTTTLSGEGWAVGVVCAPAAGFLLTGTPMADSTDRAVDVTVVLGAEGERLADRVRAAMAADPTSPRAHAGRVRGPARRPRLRRQLLLGARAGPPAAGRGAAGRARPCWTGGVKPVAVVLLLLVVSALLQLAGVDVVTGIAVAVDTTADVLVAVWGIVRERT